MKTDAADNETFFRLTPELVLEAAEDAGFLPSGHTWTLNSLENRVYDLRLEDGSHVVAKFYRPGRWTRPQILAEHDFLFELLAAEVPVCAPLHFSDGSTVREREGILFAVWPRTGGRAPDELSVRDAEMLGRMLARLHNVGAQGARWDRPNLTADSYVRQPLEYLVSSGNVPPHCTKRYTDAAEALALAYDRLSPGVPLHRIHGDCHLGNILHGDDGWFLLDFDDFCVGPAVQDMWMLFPREGPEVPAIRGAFVEGYRSFGDFSDHWWRLAEVLRGMRFIHYAAWVARRFRDPAFQDAFVHFGDEVYWEQETADLEDQVRFVYDDERGIESLATGRVEPAPSAELSNQDFFWDWEEPRS